MTFGFDPTRFIVTEFYTYPTCVVNRIAEFEDFASETPRPRKSDDDIKEFFDDCLKYVEEVFGRKMMDNKISMKIINPRTNSAFYVGYKDNIYCIGLDLNPHMKGTCKVVV